MNILNYTSYFHDESLIDIQHKESSMVISMESAEISPDENIDNIILSKNLTIKGKLHLECVYSIKEKEKQELKKLTMLHDSAEILHFEIQNTTIKLNLLWMNFPPHLEVTAYSFYTIVD